MALRAVDSNFAAVRFNRAGADREADSRAWVLSRVQAFKHAEDPPVVLGRDSDSVVLYREYPVRSFAAGSDMDLRRDARSAVLDAVRDEVLKDENQRRGVRLDAG